MAGKCPAELEEPFIADCHRLTTVELSEKYDRALSTIKEWRIGLYHAGDLLWWPGISMGDCKIYDEQIEIDGDAVVISDLEIPYHDAELLGYAVSIAKKFDIKRLVIAGDFLAVDALGYFASRSEEADEGVRFTVADSMMEGESVLRTLFEWFDHIILIKGNHEQRGSRTKEIGFFKMMENQWGDLGNLEISYYKWCRVGGYRIEHPGNYSKVPGSVSRERAEIEDESVMCAHTHHFGRSFTKDGKHQAIDLGHCTRPETRFYKTVNGTTRHPKWIAGFWVTKDGFCYPFPKEFTDWEFWLK